MSVLAVRVGVDLVDTVRLRGLIEADPAFLATAWTRAELAYCEGDVDRLAARWAAKEATMKALGVGIGTVTPLEIEVVHDVRGAPELRLSGAAARRAGGLAVRGWSLALSHEGGLAVAFVVASVETENVTPIGGQSV